MTTEAALPSHLPDRHQQLEGQFRTALPHSHAYPPAPHPPGVHPRDMTAERVQRRADRQALRVPLQMRGEIDHFGRPPP